MEISIISDRKQWNDFLTSQPHGHLLQSYEWGELTEYLGGSIYRLGALDNGCLVGAMMLTVAPVPFPISLPGLHFKWLYCSRGPTVETPHSPALAALIQEAHNIAQAEHAVVLRLEPNITQDMPDIDAWVAAYHQLGFQTNPTAIHGRRSWILDIRPPIEQLYTHFRKAWRQNIRLAEQQNVIVREAKGDDDFTIYYDLLKETSERDHFFIHGKEYHKEILRKFAAVDNAVIYIAEHEGEPVAAKMLIRFGNRCWDMFAGTSKKKPALPKSHILQYHSFQWAKAHHCTHFDFRTIPENLEAGEEMWGVYHYKKGFGGFSQLHMATQDYVYRPLIYRTWRLFVEARHTLRRIHYKRKAAKPVHKEKGRQHIYTLLFSTRPSK